MPEIRRVLRSKKLVKNYVYDVRTFNSKRPFYGPSKLCISEMSIQHCPHHGSWIVYLKREKPQIIWKYFQLAWMETEKTRSFYRIFIHRFGTTVLPFIFDETIKPKILGYRDPRCKHENSSIITRIKMKLIVKVR